MRANAYVLRGEQPTRTYELPFFFFFFLCFPVFFPRPIYGMLALLFSLLPAAVGNRNRGHTYVAGLLPPLPTSCGPFLSLHFLMARRLEHFSVCDDFVLRGFCYRSIYLVLRSSFFVFYFTLARVGTLFCSNPGLFEDSDEEEGTDDVITRQAEGARVGGRTLCALQRCGGGVAVLCCVVLCCVVLCCVVLVVFCFIMLRCAYWARWG